MNKTIYQVWAGSNKLTPNRIAGLETSKKMFHGCEIILVTPENLSEFIVPGHELHPAYEFLSMNHRSDYLRCYLMNFHGGGYADIKYYGPNNNFSQCFDIMDMDPEIEILGRKECPGGATLPGFNVKPLHDKLISCGWFLGRKHSTFTEEWYRRLIKLMDLKLCVLEHHPATDPFGGPGYPMGWTEVMGDIFHPLCAETYDSRPDAISNVLHPDRLNKQYR